MSNSPQNRWSEPFDSTGYRHCLGPISMTVALVFFKLGIGVNKELMAAPSSLRTAFI